MAVLSLFISLIFICCKTVLGSLSEDAMSLLSFKSSISRDPLNLLANWNTSGDHCHWYGVTCDSASGRVVSVNIVGRINSELSGHLPGSVRNLTALRNLSLPNNVFSGEIPAEIGSIRSLQVLELQGNNFSGMIPHQIRYLTSLVLLNLSYNSFSGRIPVGLIGAGNLSGIDLSNNQLTDELTIGEKCEFLNYLKLSNNYLLNEIPASIGKCFNLSTLLLDGNILQGHIPPEIGWLSELRVLDVSRNSFTGRIPSELGKCLKLTVLVLTNVVDFGEDDNSVVGISRGEFNAFEGGIPYEFLLLPNLQVFWVPRGNLGGRLPGHWTELCSLRVLNLGGNYLTGTIPENMALMCKNLTFLDLSSNNLQGFLPLQLRIPCMSYFNVSGNSFSGVLPRFSSDSCGNSVISYRKFFNEKDIIQESYSGMPIWVSQISTSNLVIEHDFSWNGFIGSPSSFSLGDELSANGEVSYRLFLNNNKFNGSVPTEILTCVGLKNV